MSALEYAVLVFASYRITRFLVRDSLIGFSLDSESTVSQWVDSFAYTDEGENRSWLRGKIGDLLTCIWCTGFHVSWIVLCAWTHRWPWDLAAKGWVIAFAIAGAAGFLGSRINA